MAENQVGLVPLSGYSSFFKLPEIATPGTVSSGGSSGVGLGPTISNAGIMDKTGVNPLTGFKAQDGGFLGLSDGAWGGLGAIGNIASGIGGLVLGSKQLGLAEDKFAFDKDMLTKQYDMAKDAYDKKVARAENIGDQMREGKVS